MSNSNRKFFYVGLRVVLVVACVWLILVWAPIGPGIADRTSEIINGYYYTNAGGDERFIGVRLGDEQVLRGVINARVDQFEVVDEVIHVARRPRALVRTRHGSVGGELSNECELYIINTKTRQVVKVTSDEYVRCSTD